MVLRVVEFCRARGHDADALCREAGLNAPGLADPDARVGYDVAAALGERALALTGDDNFGLHLAEDVRDTRQFDAGLLLLMASPTVRVALERMVRHQRLWGDGDRATLVRVPGGLRVRYTLRGTTGAYARHADECAMAEIALGIRVLTGRDLRPRAVRFRHPPPRALEEHRRLFGCPLAFRQPHTGVELDDAACETPMQHANAAFFAVFEEQVVRALARLPAVAGASESVRAAVRAALASGGCSLAGTARGLGVSTRTMQRRLEAEGTSFAAVVDALRRELACAYLDRQVPIPEIAALLGYADGTAFHHAFRRWTGSTPLAHAGRAARTARR
jgi:AraC-like DNA-binding protein